MKSLSHVGLLATPWTAAYQAPPPMGFSRQEYWSGVPLPSPRDHQTQEQTMKYACASCGEELESQSLKLLFSESVSACSLLLQLLAFSHSTSSIYHLPVLSQHVISPP